jgi:CYTH domain-containing protein
LVIAEVEFASAPSSASFEPPSWIGIELTGDPGYANKNLATRGIPAIAQPDS